MNEQQAKPQAEQSVHPYARCKELHQEIFGLLLTTEKAWAVRGVPVNPGPLSTDEGQKALTQVETMLRGGFHLLERLVDGNPVEPTEVPLQSFKRSVEAHLLKLVECYLPVLQAVSPAEMEAALLSLEDTAWGASQSLTTILEASGEDDDLEDVDWSEVDDDDDYLDDEEEDVDWDSDIDDSDYDDDEDE